MKCLEYGKLLNGGHASVWGLVLSPLPVHKFTFLLKDRSDYIMGSCMPFLIALLKFLLGLSFSVACAGPASC